MVEFCAGCRASLPKADLTVKQGKIFCSPDYVCPYCSRPANPAGAEPAKPEIEPVAGKDIVIRRGEARLE